MMEDQEMGDLKIFPKRPCAQLERNVNCDDLEVDKKPKLTTNINPLLDDLIVKEILKCLGFSQLLDCSLVCKKWNALAREVLRQDRRTYATLGKRHHISRLTELHQFLLDSGKGPKELPFNGLLVPVSQSPDRNCQELASLLQLELLTLVFTQIDLRHLFLQCIESCFGQVVDILRVFPAIKSLGVQKCPAKVHDSLKVQKLILQTAKGVELPTIKELFLSCNNFGKGFSDELVQSLVLSAPKLQQVFGPVTAACLNHFPESQRSAVREFYFQTKDKYLGRVLEFSRSKPKLKNLSFSTAYADRPRFAKWTLLDQERTCNILHLLLESSADSLQRFAVNQLDLILLTSQWKVPVFKKTNHLSLTYSPALEQKYSLRKIDFSKCFPHLTEVIIYSHALSESDLQYYINDQFQSQSSDHSVSTVTKLHLATLSSVGQIPMFGLLFPNVKHLYVGKHGRMESFLSHLWITWPGVNSIAISLMEMKPVSTKEEAEDKYNLDAVLLGINKEEAKGFARLEPSLQVLPARTKSSILDLKDLKEFSIRLNHPHAQCKDNVLPITVFSTLVGSAAFSKYPGLTVKIERDVCEAKDDCYLALNHLKPYARFVNNVVEGLDF